MSATPTSSTPPSGWYPDPGVQGMVRYWDGANWTQHTAPGNNAVTATAAGAPRKGMSGGAIAAIVVGITVVVLFIIGVLAAIAIPVFLNQRQKADDAAAKSDLMSVNLAIMSAFAEDPANGPTVVVAVGDTVIVSSPSSPDQLVQLSVRTEFGGYASTPGSDVYCVWVDSVESENSFQADQMGNVTEGDCSTY